MEIRPPGVTRPSGHASLSGWLCCARSRCLHDSAFEGFGALSGVKCLWASEARHPSGSMLLGPHMLSTESLVLWETIRAIITSQSPYLKNSGFFCIESLCVNMYAASVLVVILLQNYFERSSTQASLHQFRLRANRQICRSGSCHASPQVRVSSTPLLPPADLGLRITSRKPPSTCLA